MKIILVEKVDQIGAASRLDVGVGEPHHPRRDHLRGKPSHHLRDGTDSPIRLIYDQANGDYAMLATLRSKSALQ